MFANARPNPLVTLVPTKLKQSLSFHRLSDFSLILTALPGGVDGKKRRRADNSCQGFPLCRTRLPPGIAQKSAADYGEIPGTSTSDTPLSRAANCYKSTRSNAETAKIAEKRKQNSKHSAINADKTPEIPAE